MRRCARGRGEGQPTLLLLRGGIARCPAHFGWECWWETNSVEWNEVNGGVKGQSERGREGNSPRFVQKVNSGRQAGVSNLIRGFNNYALPQLRQLRKSTVLYVRKWEQRKGRQRNQLNHYNGMNRASLSPFVNQATFAGAAIGGLRQP
jgi:hypothetical protein